MPEYTAKMQHSEKTIYKLAETQFNTFQFGKKVVRVLLALLLIFLGIYIRGDYFTPWLCLIAGCILISGLNTRARYNAKKICSEMKGNYPSSQYSFYKDGFKFYDSGEIIPYSKLIKLVEDKEYLYLYISPQSAYMLDRKTVKKGSAEDLKGFISGKTGIDWVRPNSLLSFRFRGLSDRINKFQGERLK